MKKRNFFRYCFFAGLFAAGYLVNGFWGGMMAGISLCIFLFWKIGKWLAEQAISKLDKITVDHIVNNSTQNHD